LRSREPTTERVTGNDAVATLGLPRWTFAVLAAMPVAASLVALVRSESTLPRSIQIAVLAVVVLPFVVDRSRVPFKYGEVVIGLVSMVALVPLLATGSDRVLLWIPGILLVVDAALGGIRGAVPIALGAIAWRVSGWVPFEPPAD